MQETPPDAVAIAEPNPKERTCGLIGAMKDGYVIQFEYRNLIVRKGGASIEITDMKEQPFGGRLLEEPATVAEIYEWIENKAEYYGDNQ